MMRDGKSLILATKHYAVEDRARSWRLLISTAILLLLAYAGALVNVHIVPQILCGILAALLTVRMFILYHDYLHRTILQKSAIAKIWFSLYGMYILAPVSIWQRSHDFHHAHNSKLYTSSIGSFPIVTKEQYLQASKKERLIYLFIRHPLTIALGYVFMFLWGMCISPLMKGVQRHYDCLLAIVFHFGIGAAVFFGLGVQSFLIGFLMPAMISSAMGAYLFYAQHNFPAAIHHSKEDWTYFDAAMKSSSFMKMPAIMHWFTGNIGYHHIHHINPRIPFYNLPKVFDEMPEFQNPGTTSLNPIEIYRCFRVKVWDGEKGKMVGRRELSSDQKAGLIQEPVIESV